MHKTLQTKLLMVLHQKPKVAGDIREGCCC